MRFLLDTQLLIWATLEAELLSPKFMETIADLPPHSVCFSVASVWEIAIKFGRGKADFTVDPAPMRAGLLQRGFTEIGITSAHALFVSGLPHIHKDPFDRLLIAQATVERITLLTSDKLIAQYPGPIELV